MNLRQHVGMFCIVLGVLTVFVVIEQYPMVHPAVSSEEGSSEPIILTLGFFIWIILSFAVKITFLINKRIRWLDLFCTLLCVSVFIFESLYRIESPEYRIIDPQGTMIIFLWFGFWAGLDFVDSVIEIE